MITIKYDGTFEGFLTVVFECYNQKLEPGVILGEGRGQGVLFSESMFVETNLEKGNRVWNGIQKRLPQELNQLPYKLFLSELDDIEMKLFQFLQKLFDSEMDIENDFGDPNTLYLRKLGRKVNFEAMRMLQFVRFQKTRDNIYFATIQPQYDVIPLIINHFKSRFADQYWLIYDLKRDYGIYYDLDKVEEITLNKKQFHPLNGKVHKNILQEKEEEYKTLWKDYFQHINIKERKSLKVQRQHMPRRYWKFLPEVS